MNHQPFENWILDDDIELSQDQWSELQHHLKICQRCQRLYHNWQTAKSFLAASPAVSPPLGFAVRWQKGLADKRIAQHKKQVRKIFFFLILGIFITSVMLLIYAITSSGLSNTLTTIIKEMVTLTLSVITIVRVVRPLLEILPPVIPIGAWALFTTTFTVMALAWLAAIWRVTVKGENNA